MNAKELLAKGDLTAVVAALNDAVRGNPSDTHLRSFLFEALAFQGALDRASKQLDVLSAQSGPESVLAVQVYRGLLRAEEARRQVFAGTSLPKFYTTPPDWLQPSILLLAQLPDAPDAAAETLSRLEDAAPAFAGTLDGEPFSAFRDLDDRTPLVLEVFRGSDYIWLPFSEVRRVEVTAPVRLRDLLWAQARIETHAGQSGDVFLPVLYAGSHEHDDDQVRLGRTTAFHAIADAITCGAGQRIFAADDREVSLLDMRVLEFTDADGGANLA